MQTISCCLIAKSDGGGSLQRAIDSIRLFVDEIVLVWTREKEEGEPLLSGVDTVDYFTGCNARSDCAAECGCRAGDLIDFSAARNRSFEIASGDLLTYVDSDDVLIGKGNLRQFYDPESRTLFRYDYAFDLSGACTDRIYNYRVVPKGTRWVNPVHNMLSFPEKKPYAFVHNFVWRHERTPEGTQASRERGLRILRHWQHSVCYQNEARFTYYLGRAHLDHGILGRASRELERAFGLETLIGQKANIALDLTKCYRLPRHALHWAHVALELTPERSAPWFALARIYRSLGKEETATRFARGGLSCEPALTFLSHDPSESERMRREFSL